MAGDRLVPFAFETMPVRGAVLRLGRAWRRMLSDHDYSPLLTETLGHAAAATGLIANTLKFDGSITLQIQGGAALQVLVMQCSSKLELRGMAVPGPENDVADFESLTKDAHCAITVDSGKQPYQGIVAIEGASLAASLKNYFGRSVQVPSHIALAANGSVTGGIIVQQLPGEAIDADDWRRLGFLIETLTIDDLRHEAGVPLLKKLFAEDDVRVYEEKPLRFRCRCSRGKAEDILRMLGETEVRHAIDEQGQLEIVCEYCGRRRRYDAVDVARVFSSNVVQGPADVQ